MDTIIPPLLSRFISMRVSGKKSVPGAGAAGGGARRPTVEAKHRLHYAALHGTARHCAPLAASAPPWRPALSARSTLPRPALPRRINSVRVSPFPLAIFFNGGMRVAVLNSSATQLRALLDRS